MSYQDLPVQMHVNYPDFVEFMKDCKLRQPPSALEVCFWVWYNARNTQDNERIDALKKDIDRKHRECAERERQVLMLAEDNERLNDDLRRARDALAGVLMGLGGHAVGERGEACMSIDGSNL